MMTQYLLAALSLQFVISNDSKRLQNAEDDTKSI